MDLTLRKGPSTKYQVIVVTTLIHSTVHNLIEIAAVALNILCIWLENFCFLPKIVFGVYLTPKMGVQYKYCIPEWGAI